MGEHMKIIYGVVLVVLLGSCSPFGLNPMGYEVLHENLDVAWKKVALRNYIPENGTNYWKSPAEFFRDGGGDCEDFAVTLVYLLGPDAEVVIEGTNSENCHAIVFYKGMYIEPQKYNKFYTPPTNILKTWSYSDILWWTTLGGCKSI
jgi:hypothetical protein